MPCASDEDALLRLASCLAVVRFGLLTKELFALVEGHNGLNLSKQCQSSFWWIMCCSLKQVQYHPVTDSDNYLLRMLRTAVDKTSYNNEIDFSFHL